MKRLTLEKGEFDTREERKLKRLRKNKILNDSDEDDESVEELKLTEIREEIKKRHITVDQIIQAPFMLDDKIWFIEHLDILDITPEDTEEYYDLKMKIYHHYMNIIHLDERDVALELKLKATIKDDKSILKEILHANLPDHIKAIIYRRYIAIKDLDHNEEYFKHMNWIDVALRLPWYVKTPFESIANLSNKQKINKLKLTLDKYIYGQTNIKERIIESICAMLSNPEGERQIISLVGEPGVGKTALALSLAEAFELPLHIIALGGMKDSSYLTGHGMTYITSKPGEIVNALVNMRCQNGILLLDEFDKVPEVGEEVESTLLHILDYTQNKTFKDQYIPEIPIDLSKLYIIVSMNDSSKVDKVLLNRLDLIKMNGYTIDDKIQISKHHIIPNIINQLNIHNVSISDDLIKYIIEKNSTRQGEQSNPYRGGAIATTRQEEGVRGLQRTIRRIYEKINTIKMNSNVVSYGMKLKFPLKLTQKHIDLLFEES